MSGVYARPRMLALSLLAKSTVFLSDGAVAVKVGVSGEVRLVESDGDAAPAIEREGNSSGEKSRLGRRLSGL